MELISYFLLSLFLGANASSIAQGGPCSAQNNHLDPASPKFISECDDQTFCFTPRNGTCVPRCCRRDEFPFGFDTTKPLPPRCDPGTSCPDEGSGCKPLVAIGHPCELNRDEHCSAPPNCGKLASSWNFNGSICLHSICMYANFMLGQPCTTETKTYTDMGLTAGSTPQLSRETTTITLPSTALIRSVSRRNHSECLVVLTSNVQQKFSILDLA
ncbi:hypothetical protein Hypma_014915 [Hypsizygus marmoreus]|uniref:Uncharacterized protein n=1 Tax=Hypsizygus marmoreus TaxID=39966 RepID=A0A369K9L2_HYPMA|nr:hypothetical protein Hypma_014915 [Hypsizygus marmoreus]